MTLTQAADIYRRHPQLFGRKASVDHLRELAASPNLPGYARHAARFLSNFFSSLARFGPCPAEEAHQFLEQV